MNQPVTSQPVRPDAATIPVDNMLPADRNGPLELTVIAPTLNERQNIEPFVKALDATLSGIAWEVVFVDDDSADGTAALIRQIARQDRRVRCVQRLGRRGLSSAVVEGALSSAAPYIAVMDSDMQHDERLLVDMLRVLRDGDADIVVGSRYVEGGGVGDWNEQRQTVSRTATRLSRIIVPDDLKDPMSGFFMVRRDAFEAAIPRLSQQGFKILVDLFASSPTRLRFRELPYQFRVRRFGESKLDAMIAWQYLMLLLDKTVGRLVPVRFVIFTVVGMIGATVHFSVLWVAFGIANLGFAISQSLATFTALTFNYVMNNLFTYRDRRRRGWAFLSGFLSFAAVCGFGAIANVGIGTYVFRVKEIWWLAGLAGALVSAVWNYAVSATYTWKKS